MSETPKKTSLNASESEPQASGSSPTTSSSVQPNPQYPSVDYEQLAQGGNVVVVRYAGSEYQLRKTRNDRLILHK